MKYFKCRNCQFNVTSEDECCPNCGALHPLKSYIVKDTFNKQEFRDKITTIFTTIFILFLCSLYIYIYVIYGSAKGFVGACGIWLVLVVMSHIFSLFISAITSQIAQVAANNKTARNRSEINERKTQCPESLTFKKNLIVGRILEFRNRERELEPVLKKSKLIIGEQRQQVIETLEATIKMLKINQARYVIKSLEIDTVILQNKVAPIIYEIDNYSYEETDSHITKISELQIKVDKLNERVTDQKKVLGNISEIKELSIRLFETKESMIRLHDALISRQAVLVLQKIKPAENIKLNTFGNVSPVKTIRESNVFNIHVAITDFSESLKDLEFEYTRIQKEDIAVEILEMMNKETNEES